MNLNNLSIYTFVLFCGIFNSIAQKHSNTSDVEIQIDSTTVNLNYNDSDIIVIESKNFKAGETYILGGFSVLGLEKYSQESVKVYTGLIIGEKIRLPGDKLTSAIKKLYSTKQFSEIDVYVSKIEDEKIYLDFYVTELPQLKDLTIKGVRKGQVKDLKKELNINPKDLVTENLIVTTKNYITKHFKDKGFLDTKTSITTKRDTSGVNNVDILAYVDKGNRIKIKKINFKGNDRFSAGKLKSVMKNTKTKFIGRFWKRSKYIEDSFKEDLENIIKKYNSKGYRDAKIIDSSIDRQEDGNIILNIELEEGKQYYFGGIDFIGNQHFTKEQLQGYLKIYPGQIYNGNALKDRVIGDGSPDSQDISTLYLNNGYLFSQVNPVETRVENDSIFVEIRINEDEQATIRNVSVVGNDRTNDYVIYREIRTKPGQFFSKEDIIRTIREISQLGYFDAESISPDVKPDYQNKMVDIEYSLTEKGSSQIELQGGYGGGAFIGTLGLSFNNFSIKNIFNAKEYRPLPMGDGQSLSLRLQASKYYSTYSFSFTEPWLNGKRPKSLSFSTYSSKQYGYDIISRNVNKSERLYIIGASIGLGQRLKWPDDFFTLSQSVQYQLYNSQNYNLPGINIAKGDSNNLSYTISIGRNSSGPNPIFPTIGSELFIDFKSTFPYSLVNGKDYSKVTNLSEKFKWLEYWKTHVKAKWYTPFIEKSVIMTGAELGLLGYYNSDIGDTPFERFYLGGDGMASYQLDGRETIALRGYENAALSLSSGGTIYNKFQLELRYPITLKPVASIYALGFVEAGNSYNGLERYNPFNLKRSAGLGLRVFMPAFGLLGIDFGYGFDPVDNIPTSKASGWQTHFVIGQQF